MSGAERLAVLVERPRVRRERAAPTRFAEAQREVDILPVREERLVEAAELAERGEPVRGRAAAGPTGSAARQRGRPARFQR